MDAAMFFSKATAMCEVVEVMPETLSDFTLLGLI